MSTELEKDYRHWTVAPDYHNSWCDYCTEKAVYDARTHRGYFAYVCDIHFYEKTEGQLGLGKGQRLIPLSEWKGQ